MTLLQLCCGHPDSDVRRRSQGSSRNATWQRLFNYVMTLVVASVYQNRPGLLCLPPLAFSNFPWSSNSLASISQHYITATSIDQITLANHQTHSQICTLAIW